MTADQQVGGCHCPADPEKIAGDQVPDPWDEDPQRWAGTEPVPWRS